MQPEKTKKRTLTILHCQSNNSNSREMHCGHRGDQKGRAVESEWKRECSREIEQVAARALNGRGAKSEKEEE